MAVAAQTREAEAAAGGGISWERPVQWGLAIVAILLVVFPLAPLVYQSFLDKPLYEADKALTLGNYSRILTSGEFWGTLGTTLLFGAITTVLAVGIGTVLAVLLTRTDLPHRDVLHNLVMVPFYVSPLVLAFAWATIYGPAGFLTIFVRVGIGVQPWNLYSVLGIALVAAVYYVPYTYLYSTGSLALTDPQLEDAGRIAGAGPLRTLASVTLPLLRPALAYSLMLTFVSAVELLSIPLVLGNPAGIQGLASYLYKLGLVGGSPTYGGMAVVSVSLLLVTTGLVWLQTRVTGQE